MRVLAILSIVWTVLSVIAIACGIGFRVVLDTDTGIGVFGPNDFTLVQRFALVIAASSISCCWLWMLYQVVLMSFHFSNGDLVSTPVAHCLRRFAFGLFALSVAEFAVPLFVNFYMQYLGKCIPQTPSSFFYLGQGTVESLMAGALVIILSLIIESSCRMREDLELTI